MSFASSFTPPYSDPATVAEVVANQVAFSNYTIENVNEFLADLQQSVADQDVVALDASEFANAEFALRTLEPLGQHLSNYASLSLTSPTLNTSFPEVPTAPADSTFSVIPAVTIPEFTQTAPVLDFPTAPSLDIGTAPTAPVLTLPADPTAPTITIPELPSIAGITIPTAPSITLPVFSASLPVNTLVAPSSTFSWYENVYTSSLLDAASAKLLENLESGGYGIEPLDESALWDRERSRQIENTNAAIEEIMRHGAARGFPLPPGDLLVAVQRAQQDASDKLSDASRAIALKRADMYVENRKFTITETRSLETVLIGYHSSVQERSLNAAKAVLELGIQVFNATVAKYNAQLDAYKTEAAVFEAKIRAETAKAEFYRIEMEGKRLEVEVQRQVVENYKARIAGIQATIDVYKAQVDAITAIAGVRRVQADIFRGQVEAYSAGVQAQATRAQIYETGVRAQVSRATAFESQARAFTARIEGVKAVVEVGATRLKAEVETANAVIRKYEANLAGFKANIEKVIEGNKLLVDKYRVDEENYRAKGEMYAEVARIGLQQAQLEGTTRFKAIDVVIENAKLHLEALERSAQFRVEANRTIGGYATQTVAQSIGALNTITSYVKQE